MQHLLSIEYLQASLYKHSLVYLDLKLDTTSSIIQEAMAGKSPSLSYTATSYSVNAGRKEKLLHVMLCAQVGMSTSRAWSIIMVLIIRWYGRAHSFIVKSQIWYRNPHEMSRMPTTLIYSKIQVNHLLVGIWPAKKASAAATVFLLRPLSFTTVGNHGKCEMTLLQRDKPWTLTKQHRKMINTTVL